MENLRTFQCNGFKFHISDSGCWVESPDGEVKEYENRREAVLVFVKSISYPINEIEKKLSQVIEEYGYNRYTGEKKKDPRNESS